MRSLLATTLQPAFAGKADAIDAGTWLAVTGGVCNDIHLPLERGQSAEGFRIEHLHEDRPSPARCRVRPSVPGEARGERFDEDRQRETLVPRVETAEGQQRSLGFNGKNGGIGGGRVRPAALTTAPGGARPL